MDFRDFQKLNIPKENDFNVRIKKVMIKRNSHYRKIMILRNKRGLGKPDKIEQRKINELLDRYHPIPKLKIEVR